MEKKVKCSRCAALLKWMTSGSETSYLCRMRNGVEIIDPDQWRYCDCFCEKVS